MKAGVMVEGRRRTLARFSQRDALGVLSVALLFVAWTGLASLINSPYIPPPSKVFVALITSFFEKDFLGFYVTQHILASLSRIIYGFLLAALVGISTGLLVGWSKSLESLTSPIVEMIRPIPPMAWVPFAIYFFREPMDAIFIVFLAVLFPILLNTIAGVKAIDPIIVDAARTLGASGHKLFLNVVIPASVRNILTGIRIGLGVGWMSIVAAEMVGVKGGGLGYYLWSMAEIGRFDLVFSGMVLVGAIGLAIMKLTAYLENRFWRTSVKGK